MLAHRRIVPRQLHHFGLHPQCRQRAAQFVRGIGGETPLPHQQRIDAGEQRVERIHQRAHLGWHLARIQRRGVIGRAPTQTGGHRTQRPQLASDHQRNQQHQHRQRRQPGHQLAGHHAQRHIAPVIPLLADHDAVAPVGAGQPYQAPTVVIAFAFTVGKTFTLPVKQEVGTVLAVVEQHLALAIEDGERQRVIILLAPFAMMHQLLGFRQAARAFIGQQIAEVSGRQPLGEQHLLGVEHFVDGIARHHPSHHAGSAPGQQRQQAENQDQTQPQAEALHGASPSV